VAETLAQMYERDLEHSTEIVLDTHSRPRPAHARRRHHRRVRGRSGSAARAAAGALRLSHTVGAAIADRRVLGRAEAGVMAGVGVALIALTAVGILWPRVIAVPLVLLAGWIGIALVIRAIELHQRPAGEDAVVDEIPGG